jgi:hypothetical protein
MTIKERSVLPLAGIFLCYLISAVSGRGMMTERAIIDPAPSLNRTGESIFDLSVYRADIRGYRMHEALDKLSEAVDRASKGQLRFVFQISWLKPREYMQKYGGVAAWPIPDSLNPFVHYQGANIDLRTIIRSLCRQSGWTYSETITPVGYVFTVRERPDGVPIRGRRTGTARNK